MAADLNAPTFDAFKRAGGFVHKDHYTLHVRMDLATRPLWCVSRQYMSGRYRTAWCRVTWIAITKAQLAFERSQRLPYPVEDERWWQDRIMPQVYVRYELDEDDDQYGGRRF